MFKLSNVLFTYSKIGKNVTNIKNFSTSFFTFQKCKICITSSPRVFNFPSVILRCFSSTSPNNLGDSENVASKKSAATKRGPKFQTPSKKEQQQTTKIIADDTRGREWNIWAYATANEYRLDLFRNYLREQKLYSVDAVADDLPDVIRLKPLDDKNDGISGEDSEIFVFSDGAVVFWDIPSAVRRNFLATLRPFELKPFAKSLIESECERLVYETSENGFNDFKGARFRKEILHLNAAARGTQTQLLEKYTVSSVMSASVQLSIWELEFDDLATPLENVTDAMRLGKIKLSKKQAISYAGRLSTLRHNVNLYSDLLDHPDFLWERVGLERLYDRASEILCIRRRVQVFNKKLDNAMDLIQLIVNQLSTMHSARLEWLIIYLILIEVLFEAFHLWRTY